ncbi:MAG: lecithin retinol acyltransferase family protein [Jaaginema sp. PMC 1079.18]|nr:lecithin retinol acyltransferase family protein [Jaaginema sp. PMC 1080.18]MEC4854050.1 lecithin retinol acyltransferase family protein [Jaaginema sp. PMC 1079.18]MEC4868964.1 lecithin retinol acyltransferase family protein [Jaaginema sp. PMC 1078.18]
MARGDQIYVYREFLNLQGFYEHHGIDCGDDTVIHYRKVGTAEVQRTSWESFTLGNTVHLRQYPHSFVADVVVSRAESRLGEQQYNLLFNNCEHFATWCKIGISQSNQIIDFAPVLRHIKTDEWYEPIHEAISATDPNNAQQTLNQALADIKVVWDDVQPRYKEALAEQNTWQNVAKEALKRDREDLAKAALSRKLEYRKKAEELEQYLEKLAMMTENLLRNRQNL